MRIQAQLPVIAALALVCGCTTHPIAEQVTELETHDLLHKIRCEVKETVVAVYKDGALHEDGVYAKLDPKYYKHGILVDGWEGYKNESDKIKKSDDKLKAIDADIKVLNERMAWLKHEEKLNILSLDEFSAEMIRKYGSNLGENAGLNELLNKLTPAEVKRLNDLTAAHTKKKRDIDVAVVRVKIRSVTTEREYYVESKHRASLVVKRTNRYKELETFLRHRFTYQTQLKATEKNTAKSNASFKIPLLLGSMTIDQMNPADERERTGDRTVRVVASFDDLVHKLSCPANGSSEWRAGRYPIVGKVGLKEVVEQYMKISLGKNRVDFAKVKEPKLETEAYLEKITFKTTLSGGANPKVTITQATGHTLTGSLDLSGSRIDEHILTMALSLESESAGGDDKEKVTKVQIVGGVQVSQ
jgi:hypothetical protein